MRKHRLVTTALLVLGIAVTVGPIVARADGGGGTSSATSQDPDFSAGVAAIKAGDYARAIALLDKAVARDGKSADAYNWLGYATRKNGDPAAAIPIYEKALVIDPKHRGAHEYIGEAYLMLGNLARAKRHLAALESLCFLPCEEYRDLKKAVEGYEKQGRR